MKKLASILMIIVVFSMTLFAQNKQQPPAPNDKPRLVVFVVGLENDQVSDYFTNLISNNLAQNYTIIPRTEAVLKKMKELKDYDESGHIDDRQLIEWGKQYNVQTLCLVMAAHLEEYMFSAQLTDVKTNTLLNNAEYEIPSLKSDDLKKAASAIGEQLQRKLKK